MTDWPHVILTVDTPAGELTIGRGCDFEVEELAELVAEAERYRRLGYPVPKVLPAAYVRAILEVKRVFPEGRIVSKLEPKAAEEKRSSRRWTRKRRTTSQQTAARVVTKKPRQGGLWG